VVEPGPAQLMVQSGSRPSCCTPYVPSPPQSVTARMTVEPS
jgi:hypothetical protein